MSVMKETAEGEPGGAAVLRVAAGSGGEEAGADEAGAPVTREATDRVWRLFRRKLARKHPDHPWVQPEERAADGDAEPGAAGAPAVHPPRGGR